MEFEKLVKVVKVEMKKKKKKKEKVPTMAEESTEIIKKHE